MRIVIAEDSVLLRAGLTRLLTDAGEDVVAAVGDGEAAVDAVDAHQPDLVVLDVRMPPTHTDDGLRAALEIRRRWPSVGILVLSQYVEEQYATELLAVDTSGLGYLLKDRIADVADFLVDVRRVGAEVHLVIRDDGRGLPDPVEDQPVRLGVGIPGMAARIRALGGKLDVRSGPKGATVHVVTPLHLAAPGADCD